MPWKPRTEPMPRCARPQPPRDRTTAQNIRSSGRWRNLSGWFAKKFPFCMNPLQLHQTDELTEQVHHIEMAETRPEIAFTPSNLAPVCTYCHARLSAMERAGKPTAYLFTAWQEHVRGLGYR